ncbi:MAG: PspC domain-containing protein [Saprospiraceae bacterium]|nr:PspC domain-containing protein [Saprospiraceae bacterium]
MNKILNINLGGYAITIDDDAYEYLQAYLDNIRRRFSESEGRDEILEDIEARLGEIITGSMGSRTIVMLPDVEAAVNIMGKPEDFGSDETTSSSKNTHAKSGASTRSIRTGKRLYRDEEDAVVGGVCSGLTAYFGMTDPVWMRLIFVFLAFASFGFWLPAYILMWILVPPAKSAADRLAMRGEPINVDNIAKEVEEGFDRIGKKVNDIGSDSGKKAANNAQNVVNTGVTAIGQIFAFMIRFIVKFAGIIAILIAIGLFLGFGGAWITGIWALITAAPYVDYFSPFSGWVTWLGFANLFFLIGLPLAGLAMFFSRLLFKTRTPSWAGASMTFFWVINLVSAFALSSIAAREYRRSSTLSKNIDLSGITSDTIRIEGIRIDNDYTENFRDSKIFIDGWELEMNENIDIRVRRSNSGKFECTQSVTSRGRSREDALENANQTLFSIETADNKLRVPTGYAIQKGKKWKGQYIKVYIGVPDGKYIVFDNNIYYRAGAEMDEYADDNDGNYISRRPNQVFQMTRQGLVCTECPHLGDRNYRSERHYERFILEGDLKAEIMKGDEFRVRIEGDSKLVESVTTGEKITFTTNGKITNGAVRVIIETPVFTSLYALKTDEIVIRGFDEGQASITAREGSKIKAYLDVRDHLDIVLSGKSSLDLTGEGDDMDVNLTDGATLEAANWRANDAVISASDGSKARVYVKHNATIIGDATNNVRVDGGAEIKHTRD